MSSVTMLDCTLRDGGYYNAWDFNPGLIEAYLKAMAALPVDIVEIGFRYMPGTSGRFLGGCAFSTDDYIRSFEIRNGLKIAVMVNGGDLIKYPSGVKAAVDQLFQPAEQSPVELVRIAVHVNKLEETLPAIIRLKELGYRTTVNLMQIAGLSRAEIERLAQLASAYPIDILYFADSLGSMEPDDVNTTVDALHAHWKGELGFHAHNNMELALSNSIRAVDNGVTYIDSTVLGMGRGPGNTRTEYLALELESRLGRKMNYVPLLKLVNRIFKPMQQQFGWGANPYYYLAGKYGIHPSYVQEMVNNNRYDEEDILAVLEHLKTVGGKHYNTETLETARHFYAGTACGSWNPKELVQGKTVLILGSGTGAALHKDALESYIKRTRPVVIALNKQSPVEQSLIDVRAACHPVRLLADCDDHMKFPQPLIVPASMLPERLRELFKDKKLLDYGIEVKEGTFDFHSVYGVVPCSLVIAYVLGMLTSGEAERILLAGFDGYAHGDPRTIEMDDLFSLYSEQPHALPILSITPTLYRVSQSTIYDPHIL